MSAQPSIRPSQNFLFMLPATTTDAERKMVLSFARRLTAVGEVYVACAHASVLESREGLRFMPLCHEQLPVFAIPTAVFVVQDQHIADAARNAYPGAHVLVIDLS